MARDLFLFTPTTARNHREARAELDPGHSPLSEIVSEVKKGLRRSRGVKGEFLDGLSSAIMYAKTLGASWIHPMAGIVGQWDRTVRKTYIANISRAIKQAADNGLGTLVEVIGDGEVPGYGMSSYDRAEQVISETGCESLRLIFDTYHAQNITGDVIGQFRKLKDRIGHIQIADVPGRHEPGTGHIEFDQFFLGSGPIRLSGLDRVRI